jgi:CYTH domain-containing protein
MEIERKWLVNIFQALDMIQGIVPLKITQGYLNTMEDEYLIRYRSVNNLAFMMELKSKGHLSRQELGYLITKEQFEEGMKLCKTKVSKKRYCLYLSNDKVAEVDLYNEWDFITVEVEFDTEGEADFFDVPSWFGKEVTYDAKYKNINLAK